MSALRSFRSGRLRRVRSVAILTVLVVAGLLWIGSAQAVHDNGMFELDGNTVNNGTAVYDWNDLFGANGEQLITPDPVNGPILADVFVKDYVTPDPTYFTSNKDIEPIGDWGCTTINNPTPKDDLQNAYAALIQVPGDAPDNAGDQVLYVGSERKSNNGDSFAGFWLLKDSSVGCSGSGSFSGQHTDGDLLILSNYTNGGGTQDVQVYRWTGDDATGMPVQIAALSGSTCSASLSGDDACAIANSATITTPWAPTSHEANTFVEAGIDLTTLLGANGGCFTTFLAETRSSQEITATLKDYAGGSFSTCVPPTVETTASGNGSSVSIGDTTQHDVATITGVVGRPDPTGTITFFLCNPSEVTAGGCESGGTQVGDPVTIDSGSATSDNADGSLISTTGKYCWRADYTPDADASNFYSATSETNSDSECFTVVKNPTDIVTAATSGTIGDAIHDVATLSGATADAGGTITFNLYGPSDTPDCSGDPVYTNTVDVSGNGDYNSGDFTPDTAGKYYWIASYSGDDNNESSTGTCGDAGETSTIAKQPTSISTDASSAALGDPISDVATLSGATADAGGTITFSLYGPSDTPDCSGDPVYTNTVDVSGNGDYNSGDFTPDTAGSYYWIASYSGDVNNEPSTGSCGDDGETSDVGKQPTSISTDATSGSLGDAIHDVATLSDGQSPTGTITFNLYGPSATPDCSGDPVFTDTVDVDGNGDYQSADFTPTAAGTYYWIASYSGDVNNEPSTGSCGDEGETSTIEAADIQIVKTPDAAKVNVGSPIGFTMTVYNAGNGDAHGVTLTDTLPTNAGLSWTIASQGAGWGGSCKIAAGVLTCGPVTVPGNTTQAASTFTVHITSPTTGATGGDCPGSGTVNNTGNVTTTNDGSDEASASTCVQALVDLSITKSGSPATQELGAGNITWTILVKNNGPSADTNVQITDPMPAGNTFVSATSTKGTCTGGAVLSCNIGTMAAGETVTITLVTTPSTEGNQVNTVTVTGGRPETNTANNTASATVLVTAKRQPPVVYCVAVSKVTPKQLFVGRKTTLTIHVTQHGKAKAGVHVLIRGPHYLKRTKASNAKGVIKQTVKMKKAGALIFSPIASKRCNTKRIGVTGVFTPPVTG
jgi:uncharacterized repeat protein (TIGR01451 family)